MFARLNRDLMALAFATVSLTSSGAAASPCTGAHWIAVWAASPGDAFGFTPALVDQSLRMMVNPTFGGDTLRIRLSNRFGSTPVELGPVAVGLRVADAQLVAGANRPVTFGGERSITIDPGEDVTSDPVSLTFAAFHDLAVSIHVPGVVQSPTEHFITRQTSYLSPAGTGDRTADEEGAIFVLRTGAAWSNGWFFLSGVDVLGPDTAGTVVAFGDSITDGFQALAGPVIENPKDIDANTRYPDFLARRLAASGRALSLANEGISGNKVLADAETPLPFGPKGLDRLDADALDLPGVTDVIVLEGTNDIAGGATAEQVIEGLSQMISRIQARGLVAHIGTLTPSGGTLSDPATGDYGSDATNAVREAINDWIRNDSGADHVIDFDAVLRDSANPSRLRPEFDSSDHLHPSSAGYQAMAAAIDLGTLRGRACSE